MKRNSAAFGLIIGLFFPIVGFAVAYLIKYRGMALSDLITAMTINHSDAATMLTYSIVANLVPFSYFITKKRDLTGRGIFIGTMLYVVIIVLLRFVWN